MLLYKSIKQYCKIFAHYFPSWNCWATAPTNILNLNKAKTQLHGEKKTTIPFNAFLGKRMPLIQMDSLENTRTHVQKYSRESQKTMISMLTERPSKTCFKFITSCNKVLIDLHLKSRNKADKVHLWSSH